MNISKKKLALIFIPVLALLSTVFAYVVLGYTFLGGTNFPFPDEIVVQGECGLSIQFGAAGGIGAGYVTLLDLATNPGILCCEQNNVEGIRDVEDLAGPNGSTVEGTMFKPSNATLDALFPEGPARGWEDYGVGDKIKITQAQWELIGEGEFTGKTLSYYSLVGGGAASPKEAYILSELGNLSPHVGIHYDIEDPTPVDPASGYFNFNNRFELGEEEFFFGQYKWVEATGSGDALSGEPGPGGTYEWVKVRRVWGRNSGEVEYVSKTGVHYTWSEPISSDLYDSGVETLPGGSGKGIVPDNVVVHIEGEGYYKCRLITGGCSIQIAWWTTQAGGGGGYSGGNALAEEAQLFEDYIYDISGGELKRKTATWKDEEGNIHTDINAFDFEYNPSWVTGKVGEIDYDNITVRWEEDTQTAVIGPFAIDYYEAHAHVKDRNYVQFAGIFNMELYTDASEEPLKFGENNDWSFVWLEGNREKPGDLKFPKPNETFYVRMKYIEGATKITDFKVFFKYMNAAGSYAIYKGTYQIQIWERGKVQLHAQGDWVEATVDDNGVTIEEGHYDECQHWEFDMHLVTKEDELQAQKLAQGLYGARWYELCEITRSIDIYTGKLKIYKDIVDSEENVINEQDPNKWFHFTVSVQGAINSGEEWLEVRPGDSVESKVYYWVKGSDAPTFTVTESEDDEYTALYMECLSDGRKESGNTISGTLDSNKTITLRAVNFCERKARIEIEKKIKDNKEYLLDKEFKFDVTVKGDFVYDGKHYTEKQPLVLTDIIVTPKKSWISSEFLWYGAEEPTYEVVEKDVVPGAQIVSITGDGKGKLVNGLTTPITITAENELIREKGLIRIIKTLKYAELYDEDEIMKLKFNFIVKVDRYKDMYISIPAIREGNTYVWRATIGYYEWDYGNNPHYSIEEVDNPEGTTLDTASASEGIMTANENHIAVVDNYVVNIIDRPNYGKIKITKKIDSEELKGKYFDFDLCITGAFEYNNKKYEEGTYRVSNIKWNETDGTYEILSPENIRFIKKESDENKDKDFIRVKVNSDETIWESKLFKWYGDTAPTYTIEEENQGTGIDYEVTPTQGELIGGKTEDIAGIVSILATNRFLPRKGQLQIIKKVINSEYLSPEYVKSLKFNFDVDVERFGHQTITLSNPVLEGNEWVWRSEVLDYSWLVDEGTPHYKVTEIAGTSGPQFDHADNQEGELIPNELGVIDFKTTEVSVYNKANPNTGKLKIDKKSADSSLDGKEFEFDVTISGTFIYDGTTYKNTSMKLEKQKASTTTPWVSKDITWYGEAPTYSVTELPSEYADLISVIGGSGVIVKDTEVTATFENKVKETGGYLQITKQINSGVQYKDEFKFEVRIAKAGEDINSVQPRIITLRANDTY